MANEEKKDFNAMLHDSKDMPKFQTITDKASIEKYDGDRMYFAPPINYDTVMKKSPVREGHYRRRNQGIFCETVGSGLHRADYGGDFRVNSGLGKLSALGQRNTLLANAQSERRAERKIPRGRGGAKRKA